MVAQHWSAENTAWTQITCNSDKETSLLSTAHIKTVQNKLQLNKLLNHYKLKKLLS